MKSKKVFFISLISLIFTANFIFAQKTSYPSFEQQNKKARYISFSFGMGVDYGDNKSLKRYIEYELPFYNNVPVNERLSDFETGFQFFGGAELQLSRDFALKGEYAYFVKSYNATQYPDYDFTYYNHQPYLTMYYLMPQEYSFIKIGAGVGYLASGLTEKSFGNSSTYTSNGIGTKLDIVLNLQISKSFAGYLGGYLNKTFQSDLKKSDGSVLLDKNNESVNLNSFSLGLRLGFEIFFFKI